MESHFLRSLSGMKEISFIGKCGRTSELLDKSAAAAHIDTTHTAVTWSFVLRVTQMDSWRQLSDTWGCTRAPYPGQHAQTRAHTQWHLSGKVCTHCTWESRSALPSFHLEPAALWQSKWRQRGGGHQVLWWVNMLLHMKGERRAHVHKQKKQVSTCIQRRHVRSEKSHTHTHRTNMKQKGRFCPLELTNCTFNQPEVICSCVVNCCWCRLLENMLTCVFCTIAATRNARRDVVRVVK